MDVLKLATRYSYQVSDFTLAFFGREVAVANYRLDSKSLTDPREDEMDQITDTLVHRDGRWQILAEHTSTIPKPIEPVIAGMPIGWRRGPDGSGDQYQITVDTSIKHSGKASASLKFACGSDSDAWAYLSQNIAADDFRGKRVRLSGWLKTNDVTGASLIMRVDGERQMLAFDNMDNRTIKGTTDWKWYSLVLDVPVAAKQIFLGVLPRGRGQTWADDLKLEVVDQSVPSTNLSEPKDLPATKRPKVINPHPINLGFEDGEVH
jgi:hypothetical protein